MMRHLVLAAVLGVTCLSLFTDTANSVERSKRHGGGWKCRRWWCRRQSCDPYDETTQVCCAPYGRQNCCADRHIHDKPVCTSLTTYHAHPCICTKYFRCFNNELTIKSCPPRGAWNNDTQECAMVTNNRPSFCAGRMFPHCRYLPIMFHEFSFTAVDGRNDTTIISFNASAPFDTAMNMLFYSAATMADFKMKTSFDVRTWYHVSCINSVCSYFDRDRTFWTVYVDGQKTTKGLSLVMPRYYRKLDIKLVLIQDV